MKLQITIELDNEAFQPNSAPELTRIMHRLINTIAERSVMVGDHDNIFDINGNAVGFMYVTCTAAEQAAHEQSLEGFEL